MMRLSRYLPLTWAVVLVFSISNTAVAQGKSDTNGNRHFGIGHPKTTTELPNGKLRHDMENLPAKARGKALGWLQRIEFPIQDIESMRISDAGDVYYADLFQSHGADVVISNLTTESTGTIDQSSALTLHSRPGSNNILYLDFDGHTVPPNAWRTYSLEALPFDPSRNDSPATQANFTQDELNRIHEIWHRIAEDYAPFDIDVTTEEPAVFTNTTGHLLFTHDVDAVGNSMPSAGAGGTAFIDVFGQSNYAHYSPAFVYYTNLSSSNQGLANYCADAAAHEFGHNLGLSHDGMGTSNYYEGHGSGLVSWAPIMGKLYYKNVSQWSKGEYPGASNPQDDLAKINNKLGPSADDHGNSAAEATPLIIEPNGDIIVSSPEIDPDNVISQNKGVIEDATDIDWFYFEIAGSGSITLTATPAWHSFPRVEKRGANLDIELSILDSNLNTVDFSEPHDDTNATLSAALSAGRYYVLIDGVGNDTFSDYSDYASIGMYFLEGFIDAEVVPPQVDIAPPTPGTMSWTSAPNSTGQNSISMESVLATDESGPVEYYFSCVAGGQSCVDSGWQNKRTFELDGLAPATYYAFKVQARDIHGNENTASQTFGVTTDSPPANQPPKAVIRYTPDPTTISKGKTVSVTLIGTDSLDPDGAITSWSWRDGNGSLLGSSPTVSVKLREGTYWFTLTVTDDNGTDTSASVEIAVSKGGGDDDGSGDDSRPGKPPKKK